MTGWLARLRPRRPLMLRTRFTLAAAGAVAAVTLAVTAVAFLVLRSDLQDQVQQQLRQQSDVVYRVARHYHGHIPAGWVPPHSDRFGVSSPYAQVVTSSGAVWAPPGDGGLLAADTAAKQVAAGRHGSYYAVSKLDGVRAMVYTTPLAPGLAVQLAVPLATVDQEVTSVGTTLALLSVIGVGLAALAGWAVARAGLAPVGRLAAVAEDVSATGDPGRRVEVHRADELGRLAASFNTMLGALQRSLSAQRQLVSDASHELRTPLTSLRLNAEMLAAEPGLPEPERREVLDRVVAQVAELGQLVASVTELARDESQPGPLGEVELHQVVEASLAGARRDWPQTVFTAELEPWPVARAAPTASRSRSGTCWTTRPSSARPAPRSRCACGPASSPCAITARASPRPTCPMSSTVSTGRRRPAAFPVPASGCPSSARWPSATAGRSGPKPPPERERSSGSGYRARQRWANPAPDAALAGSAP